MSSLSAAPCTVVLKQQREQIIQHHSEQCDPGAIAPCNALSANCTVVENGQVVVKSIVVQPTKPADTETEA